MVPRLVGTLAINVPCKVRLKLFTLDDALVLRRVGMSSKQGGNAVKKGRSRLLAVG